MEREPEDRGGHEQAPRRVIIADDHELARLGLRTMLAPEPDLEVVGEAATGREAIDLTRKLEPDLVLMDIRMPDLDGLAATRAIKEALPRTSILIVTLSEDPDYLMEALRVGAAGFVLKDLLEPGSEFMAHFSFDDVKDHLEIDMNVRICDPPWGDGRNIG